MVENGTDRAQCKPVTLGNEISFTWLLICNSLRKLYNLQEQPFQVYSV